MMESMHYVNIFETKGLEYLLVISFLIGFVFLVRRLNVAQVDGIPDAALESALAASDNVEMLCPAGEACPFEQRRMMAEDDEDEAVVA